MMAARDKHEHDETKHKHHEAAQAGHEADKGLDPTHQHPADPGGLDPATGPHLGGAGGGDGGGPTQREGEHPEQQVQAPQFPVLTETAHPTEFVLSEGNGQISRDAAYLAHPITVKVGQPLKQTAPATATLPATFVPAAVGADCSALALYGGTSTDATLGLRIAVLTRNAEVNGKLISWGAITVPEQALGVVQLATHGIIVR
jgi:hypothetical protein